MSIDVNDNDRFVIFDIDNCVADDGWRLPLIKWDEQDMDARYEDYHRASIADKAANYDTFERHTAHGGHNLVPIFLTARPVRFAAATEAWLREKLGVDRHILICRNNDDHRSSVAVKRDMVSWLFQYGVRLDCVVRAYDDRADICAMYREYGIEAIQMQCHDVCAMTPPKKATKAPAPEADRVIIRLGEAIATRRERSAVYGDGAYIFGDAAAALFPDGLTVKTPHEWVRLSIVVQLISKLARYTCNFEEGGHEDSAHDGIVYNAMLAEMTVEAKR